MQTRRSKEGRAATVYGAKDVPRWPRWLRTQSGRGFVSRRWPASSPGGLPCSGGMLGTWPLARTKQGHTFWFGTIRRNYSIVVIVCDSVVSFGQDYCVYCGKFETPAV